MSWKPYHDDEGGADNEVYELSYSTRHHGYIKKLAGKLLEFKPVTAYDFFCYKAGDVTNIFPQYNEKEHFITSLLLDNNYSLAIHKIGTTSIHMPYGAYYFEKADYDWILRPYTIASNRYIEIKQTVGAALLDVYKDFLSRKSLYEKENELHRAGTFLYGPPGCGKTREIIRLADSATELEFYMLFINTAMPITALVDFKNIFSGKNIIVVIEEITDRMSKHDVESMLSFLDGEASWNNCYVIATSNYPELMPANIIDRPGRFNKIIEVGFPTVEQKTSYMQGKGLDKESIAFLLKELPEKLSVDYLREIVLLHKTTQQSFPEILNGIKDMRKKISSAFKRDITLNKG